MAEPRFVQSVPPSTGLPVPPPLPPDPFPPAGGEPGDAAIGSFGPMPDRLTDIVRIAHDRGYSDVHLGVGEEPRYRSRGDILRTGWPVTEPARFQEWLREMLEPAVIDAFLREKEYDGSHSFGFVRVRINLLDTVRGPGLVLRLVPIRVPTMEELGLPEVLRTLAHRPKGMVLFTGPTGSGKTTTLAALLEYVNSTMRRHIITIEDPVEFVHDSRLCLIRQREVGHNTTEFHRALRSSLREDPDLILIGEIRDQETLTTAIEASQTGHLVLGTLHTNSAVRSVERVLGLYPPQEQESIRRAVAEALLAVISLGLVKTVDGERTGFYEIFINTDACRDYIQRGDIYEIESIMQRSGFDGMQTFNQSLAALVQQGRITGEEAISHSLRPAELAQTLRGRV
ncbi:MAG: PilT/PilU family type 4a pilus ATPase [Synechococcaceae cyanobacterium]|nr:PilT/PilU family type 4a pilus ATPase [Synechococcaceae cyanobacterium]